MNRMIKFRAWNKVWKRMIDNVLSNSDMIIWTFDHDSNTTEWDYLSDDITVMQFTGLHDKNGEEIYEHMEIDNLYEVSFSIGCYILTNISNGDIISLYKYMEINDGQIEITREYTKI